MSEKGKLLAVAAPTGRNMNQMFRMLQHMQLSIYIEQLEDDLKLLGREETAKKLGLELLESLESVR